VRWRDVFIPGDRTFGRLLAEQADVARRGVQLLQRFLDTRDGGLAAEMTGLEAEGDAARRRLAEALRATYATPFDREDLYELSRLIDDVLDAAQEALLTLAVFEVERRAHLAEMTAAAAEGAAALAQAVGSLTADPAATAAALRRVKQRENDVTNLCRYGLQLAYSVLPPDEALRVREGFGGLRAVGRALARAADRIGDILVKEP
jgi:uncharacterized protein Yka (UPF0111/DUF47 family)